MMRSASRNDCVVPSSCVIATTLVSGPLARRPRFSLTSASTQRIATALTVGTSGALRPSIGISLVMVTVLNAHATYDDSNAATSADWTVPAVSMPVLMSARVKMWSSCRPSTTASTTAAFVAAAAAFASCPATKIISSLALPNFVARFAHAVVISPAVATGAVDENACESPASKNTGPAPGTNVSVSPVLGTTNVPPAGSVRTAPYVRPPSSEYLHRPVPSVPVVVIWIVTT